MDNAIKLTDSNGHDVYFEFLDLIEFDNEEYVILLPIDDTDGEVVILKIESIDDPEMESYCSVEDEYILIRCLAYSKKNSRMNLHSWKIEKINLKLKLLAFHAIL